MRRAGHARRSSHNSSHDVQAGLTLVELLVSLLLAAILTVGLFYMMSGQKRVYQAELTNATTQENIWGAMEYLQRNIRMAGFGMGGCPAGQIMRYDSAVGGPPDVSPWIAPIRVYNGCNLLTNTSTPPCPSSVADSPDSFTVARSANPDGFLAARTVRPASRSLSSEAIVVEAPGSFYDTSRPANLMALWQPGSTKACTLLNVTGSPIAAFGAFSLPHAANVGFNPPDTVNVFPTGGYDLGALVIDVSAVAPRHFAVDIDPTNPQKIPRLVTWTAADKSDVEVVAEGVEDLQIAYACDDVIAPATEPNGEFDEGINATARRTDEWAHNADSETDSDLNGFPDPMLCANGIGAVRVTLTSRSPSESDTAQTNYRAAAEDRPQGPNDAYRRRRLAAVVQPRNVRSAP